jgi:GT2 family glycosyltransferase
MDGKLARMTGVIDQNPDCVLAGSDAVQVNDEDQIVRASYVPALQAHAPSMAELLSNRWNLLPSTWIMRRSAFDAIGGFCPDFRPGFIACEDSYFLLRMREVGPFAYLPEPLVRYRMAPSLARRLERRSAELFRMRPGEAVEQIVASHQLFVRLVHERYGRSARRLIQSVRKDEVNLLAGAALAAMALGERAIARRIYLNAIRRGPQRCKTAARLAFASLPDRAARMAAARLSPRLARSVMGPAQI